MSFQKAIQAFLVIIGLPIVAIAQSSYGGSPIGLQKLSLSIAKNQSISEISIGGVHAETLLKEDSDNGLNRFAIGTNLSINLDTGGSWDVLANGDKLWRTKLTSSNALGISVLFKDFRLPEGAKLFVYSTDGRHIKGAYTHRNNKTSGKFMAGIIEGSEVIIEYYEPAMVSGMGYFEIYKAYKVYDPIALTSTPSRNDDKQNAKDFGDSSDCHINSSCPEASDWEEYKKGVARITMVFENAMGFCTGTLMNNVRQDNKPYILSAFHCSQGAPNPLYDHWQFDFNYESDTCEDPNMEPNSQSIQGCEFRSGLEESDFVLLELDEAIPASIDVRYHGWDRSENVPDTAIMMHHPLGDIMKFSFAAEDIRVFNNSINWNIGVVTPPEHHFVTTLKQGIFETGSSGAAFIDQDGYVIGQLNGGNIGDCTTPLSYFGRLFQSWSNSALSNSLQPYLDPDNTGVMRLDPLVPETPEGITISGIVRSAKDEPMGSVTIRLSGDVDMMTTTDTDGSYTFSDVPSSGSYVITPEKSTTFFDGTNGSDMLVIRKDILGIEKLDQTAEFIAADVSNNGKISTADMLQLQRLILGIINEFPNNQSWRFYTSDFPSGLTSANPFAEISTTGSIDSATVSMPIGPIEVDFVGIKIGDPTLSVDPNK